MNVWEAYQHLKGGKVIRVPTDSDATDVSYIFRTVEEPLGIMRFKTVRSDDFSTAKRPEAFKDLEFEALENVCIKSFEEENYEVMTMEELLEEAQRFWDEENEE